VIPLVDGFGRRHRDLRISVTDRCNFRCVYCMPAEGLRWVPHEDILTYEEIVRVAHVLVHHYGVDSIRLTGGEPTVRVDLPDLVSRLSALQPPGPDPVDLALTTNGVLLDVLAERLVASGLRRINISCDSLRRERFRELTRRDGLEKVLRGIDAAIESGLRPVKLNVVLMRGVNDDEILDFVVFGRERGVVVRFIEFMPLDADRSWALGQVVSQDEVVEIIDAAYPLEAVAAQGAAPASTFRYRDGMGEIGIVPSVTKPFCGRCDRIRLTAEGKLRNCLFAVEEFDVREILRSGGTDADLAAALKSCVEAKWAGHAIGTDDFERPQRSMSQIGG
jgi:GTP 3',8-cyclase